MEVSARGGGRLPPYPQRNVIFCSKLFLEYSKCKNMQTCKCFFQKFLLGYPLKFDIVELNLPLIFG